jgi:hypothetical protein
MATEETSPLNGVNEDVHIVKFVVYFHALYPINNSLMIRRPTPTARVVLPSPSADIDTDEDAGEDGEAEEIDDGDFLADFPDNTEVRCNFRCI